MQPMINFLVLLSHYLFDNFGLAVIALTIIVNGAMLPLTLKQLHASKAMQALQPKLAELQKKYAKEKEKLGQEQMKLYKESGISPAGCVVPLIVQMPIWIALYQSIIRLLAASPEDFMALSQYLYSWPVVYSAVPLGERFLWLNLAQPDSYIVLPVLVAASMWVQQKMVAPSATDSQQAAQGRLMLWMMPLMFGFFTLQFPSGLALFWVTSSVIRIGIQYFVTGWGGLFPGRAGKQTARDSKYRKRITQIEEAPLKDAEVTKEEAVSDYGKPGDKRQDARGSDTTRTGKTRRQPRRGGGYRPKGG